MKVSLYLALGIFLMLGISCVTAYYCVGDSADNIEVQKFKLIMNNLILKNDIASGLTEDQIMAKMLLIDPCNKWGND